MRNLIRVLALVSAMILASRTTWAQEPPPPPNPLGVNRFYRSLQGELKLTDQQLGKLQQAHLELAQKYGEETKKLQDLKAAEKRAKFQELMKQMNEETDQKVAGILSPEQWKRYKQIQLQGRGAEAFLDPGVRKDLKLTDEQVKRIQAIQADAGKQLADIVKNSGSRVDEAMRQMENLRKETAAKALAVFTDEQKKAWHDLVGEPFEFQGHPPRPVPSSGEKPSTPPPERSKTGGSR